MVQTPGVRTPGRASGPFLLTYIGVDMAITIQQNTPTALKVDFTLGGLPGEVDTSQPIVWALVPSDSGVIVADEGGMSAMVTMSALGMSEVSVTADANLAGGILDLVVSETLDVAEPVVVGADGGTITEVV